MRAREVRSVAGEFTVFVTARDARRSQQSLTPGPQLAVAARDSAVLIIITIITITTITTIIVVIVIVLVFGRASGKRLPASPGAQRASLRRCVGQLQPRVFDASQICHLDSILLKLYQLTLHPEVRFLQA